MHKLKNKTAVITGGNSGIGLAAAQDFIQEGAHVLITGKDVHAVEKAAQLLGSETIGVVANQASLADIEVLVQRAKSAFGKVDILFINAGIATMSPFETLTEAQFDLNMDVNFKGAFFTLQKFLPVLNDGASVIFLSSVNAYTGMPGTAVYAASKAAMNSLTRTAAYELAGRRIRVNAVCPGLTETPLFGKVGLPAEAVEEFGGAMQQRIPFKRFGQPAEVAKIVTFLASEDSAYITGSEYVIDGGVNLNPILI